MNVRTSILTTFGSLTLAGFATAQITTFTPNTPALASQVNANFTTVQNLANAAQTAANAAQGTASAAQTSANAAQSTANGAQTGVNNLQTTVGNLTSGLTVDASKIVVSGNRQLAFDPQSVNNRKVVLYQSLSAPTSDHRFFGFGINPNVLRYQTEVGADHVFYAATSNTASSELMRVLSNGDVAIGTTTPRAKLHVNGRVQIMGNASGPNQGQFPTTIDLAIDDNDTGFDVGPDGQIEVYTNNISRMTVNNSGNVGVGTTAPADRLHVASGRLRIAGGIGNGLQIGDDSENGSTFRLQRATAGGPNLNNLYLGMGTNDIFIIQQNGTDRFQFHTNGGVALKPGGGSWGVLSDERSKRDIQDLEGALDRLLKLEGKTFYYKNPEAPGAAPGKRTGFVAQQVEGVFSEWVHELPDGTKTLSIDGFEAMTVESLRELDARSKDLEQANVALVAENDELRGRLEALEAAVAQLQPLLAARK